MDIDSSGKMMAENDAGKRGQRHDPRVTVPPEGPLGPSSSSPPPLHTQHVQALARKVITNSNRGQVRGQKNSVVGRRLVSNLSLNWSDAETNVISSLLGVVLYE